MRHTEIQSYKIIELKANQRALLYGIEYWLKAHTPIHSYTDDPELGHGRIETRTYRIYDGLDKIADKQKWGGNMTIVEQALVHRKHALGTGRQSPARQDQTTHEQGCTQSRYNTQNNLLCVLHLEKAPKKEDRQEKRNGRDYETHLCKFYETHQLFMPKMKK